MTVTLATVAAFLVQALGEEVVARVRDAREMTDAERAERYEALLDRVRLQDDLAQLHKDAGRHRVALRRARLALHLQHRADKMRKPTSEPR